MKKKSFHEENFFPNKPKRLALFSLDATSAQNQKENKKYRDNRSFLPARNYARISCCPPRRGASAHAAYLGPYSVRVSESPLSIEYVEVVYSDNYRARGPRQCARASPLERERICPRA